MKRSYSLEEKLCAIGFVFQGESARSVSRRFHLGRYVLILHIRRGARTFGSGDGSEVNPESWTQLKGSNET